MALEILTMDLSSTVIGSAISVFVVIISYFVYKVGIGEKSFEEVIEEQKRRSIEEEMKQKSEKGKKEKKFKKTWGKKSKEKTEPEVSPELVQDPEMKDVYEIEIIQPKEVKLMKQSKKTKANSATQQASDMSPKQEKAKKEASPVLEKPVQEKKNSAPIQEKKNSAPEVEKVKVESKLEVKEAISVSTTSVQTASQPVATASKKKKKEQIEKDVVSITTSKVISFIKENELEAEEIQNLIDVLLNKQKDSSGWTKKNDPLALAKKNLQEKEHLLDQEQRQSQAVTSKLKDLREEYNSFKAKMSVQEKVNQEKITRHQQEIQTLTARVKQVQEQLVAEREKSAQVDKESVKKLQDTVKSLEEEKAKLQQKISQLENESLSAASQPEFEALQKSRDDLQKVHTLLVEQHAQLVTANKNDLKNLQTQLSDSKAKIEDLNAQNMVLTKDIQAGKEAESNLELAKRTIEDKLKTEEKRSVNLDAQIKQCSTDATDLAKLLTELKELKSENQRLADQLVTTKERVAGDGQEIVHQNGELNGKSQVPEKSLDDKDKLLEEKETLLAQLNDDINKLKAKISLLNEEIEVQKRKNNELREKNWKAMEALTNAEKGVELRIKEIQSAADQKVASLEKDFAQNQLSSTKGESSPELTEKLKKAENESVQRLLDYNKEVEKNRQLSSEITKVTELQKSSDQRIAEMQKTVEELKSDLSRSQTEIRERLQRICPSVSIDSSLPFEKWLLEFEQLAVIESSDSRVNVEKLLEEKENEYLVKHRHYEQVLAETESTLLKLQESAESQEVLWTEKLRNKELELKQIQSERDALFAEKEAMQSTIQQISQLEELQEKLKLLQNTLENAENERSQFEQKYEEVHKNCLNLRDQIEDKEKQITELQKESSRLDNLQKEIDDLKTKLDKEKRISKDFSTQMIKLNSLVKIGQDALLSEQEMVKKLKEQLDAAQVSIANGTTSATKASPVTINELQSPKTKSSEKSKKKMDASVKK